MGFPHSWTLDTARNVKLNGPDFARGSDTCWSTLEDPDCDQLRVWSTSPRSTGWVRVLKFCASVPDSPETNPCPDTSQLVQLCRSRWSGQLRVSIGALKRRPSGGVRICTTCPRLWLGERRGPRGAADRYPLTAPRAEVTGYESSLLNIERVVKRMSEGDGMQGKDDSWLTTVEVSNRLKIPPKTLANWASLGKGPRYVRIGRFRRYRWSDLLAWEQSLTTGGDSTRVSDEWREAS